MMTAPRIGQRVQIHYRASMRDEAPHHGECGNVTVCGRKKPRNHRVRLDSGIEVVVPYGNLKKAPPRILHLTLKREWFDKIASGQKVFEYRKATPYWTRRLSGRTFDEVHFRNGYWPDNPFMRVEWRGLGATQYCGVRCFEIELGRVLETTDWPSKEKP